MLKEKKYVYYASLEEPFSLQDIGIDNVISECIFISKNPIKLKKDKSLSGTYFIVSTKKINAKLLKIEKINDKDICIIEIIKDTIKRDTIIISLLYLILNIFYFHTIFILDIEYIILKYILFLPAIIFDILLISLIISSFRKTETSNGYNLKMELDKIDNLNLEWCR